MIVRKEKGELILIGQTDHSRLVGQLGAHWGNDRFEAPRPYDSIARAAAFHDYGWLRYETSPLLDLGTGETPEFRKVPLDPPQLESFQWALDWMSSIDRYSGLIINMHRTGLWRARYETIKYPQAFNIKRQNPDVEAFIEKNEAWQAKEKASFDTDEVWTNYRLLQVWDLLGLYFCCQDPCDDYIEPVPVSYNDGKSDGVRLTMKALGPRKVAFDPYPFGVRPCHVQLSYKRLPQTSFPDQESFRRAYFQAETDVMKFELV
jgi:hypothetical protein